MFITSELSCVCFKNKEEYNLNVDSVDDFYDNTPDYEEELKCFLFCNENDNVSSTIDDLNVEWMRNYS